MIRPARSALLLPIALAGCSRQGGNDAPPRVDTPATFPRQTSTIVVPLDAPLADLEATLDREVPRRLWRIDEHKPRCIKARKVDLGIGKVKLVPDLGCRIVGQVTRGAIRLSGRGDTLVITLPVQARIAAEKVGGVVSETATGAATVRAVARLSVAPDWSPRAKLDLSYDWTTPPGIDLLGQRIVFVDKADERLKPVVAELERTLPRELAKLRLRDQLASAWARGFTSLSLNRDNPPAWLRITPQRLGFGGYRVRGRRMEMLLAAEAVTETFVGPRPADPTPAPLPPPSAKIGARGLRFFLPVLADYRQLEPVVLRTLRKLATQGIRLPGIGSVDATFNRATVYATGGGRLAVGIDAEVRGRGSSALAAKGTVWLTAIPYNDPNSQLVRVRDLQIAGDTDSALADTLLALFSNTAVQESIRQSLSHDFAKDYAKLLADARREIGSRREGDFILSATIGEVRNGRLAVTGQGLFLPVEATGTATIAYRPAGQ